MIDVQGRERVVRGREDASETLLGVWNSMNEKAGVMQMRWTVPMKKAGEGGISRNVSRGCVGVMICQSRSRSDLVGGQTHLVQRNGALSIGHLVCERKNRHRLRMGMTLS